MIIFKLLLQLISNFPLYVTYGFKKISAGVNMFDCNQSGYTYSKLLEYEY